MIWVVEFLLKSYNCVHISIMCCHLDIRISKTSKHEASIHLCAWYLLWMMWNETVSYNPAIVCQMTSHYSQHLSSGPGPGHCWSPVKLTSNRGQKQKIYQVENPFRFLQLKFFVAELFRIELSHLIPSIATNHQNSESVSISDSALSISLSPLRTKYCIISLCFLRMKIILWSKLRVSLFMPGYECDVLPIHLNWSPLSPGWAAASRTARRQGTNDNISLRLHTAQINAIFVKHVSFYDTLFPGWQCWYCIGYCIFCSFEDSARNVSILHTIIFGKKIFCMKYRAPNQTPALAFFGRSFWSF